MDKEQVNELKPGDEVLIRGRFEKIKDNGDFQISYLLTTVHDKLYMYKAAVHPSAVIIKSSPKHDPTRLLKEGDIVKPRFVDGRTDIDLSSLHPYTVTKREDAWGNVRVMNVNHSITTKAVFLELVTPVEELEPYRVELLQDGLPPDTYHFWAVMDKTGQEVARFWCEQYEEGKAEAAAEAECKRLNAEYRKEQGND